MSAGPPIFLNPRLQQHPDYARLRVNANYYWDRMLASVAQPFTLTGEVRQLRTEIDELRQVVREGRR